MTPEIKDLIGEPVGRVIKDHNGKVWAMDSVTHGFKGLHESAGRTQESLYTATQLQPLIQRLEEAERRRDLLLKLIHEWRDAMAQHKGTTPENCTMPKMFTGQLPGECLAHKSLRTVVARYIDIALAATAPKD